VPLLDVWSTRRLKESTDPHKKIKCYVTTIVLLWALSTLVWRMERPGFSFAIVDGGAAEWWGSAGLAWGLGAWLLFCIVASILLAYRQEKFRSKLRKAMTKLNFILPVTVDELRLFAFVAVTAGICEETLYRGFLIRYFTQEWHWNIGAALILQAVMFGLAHTYQGLKGIGVTAFLGGVFAALYLMSGALILPMLIHVVIDLRILMFPAETRITETA
jgi:uncharacterized protein